MQLSHFMIAFSGGAICFVGKSGEFDADYQVSSDLLEVLEFIDDEIVMLESFGKIVRRTEIKVLVSDHDSSTTG